MRDQFDGELASQFTSGVCTHPIGDDQEVADTLPVVVVCREDDGVIVLIVRSAHSNIGQRGDLHGGMKRRRDRGTRSGTFEWVVGQETIQSRDMSSGGCLRAIKAITV